ncbi:LPS export ABC transporter permease LptF [Gayadomonas joobiniege]|uniref:LPS export ABC transporter permease LptF n=1 Tax=Gayadomonas joobiniege TaxID=1234606 RepID=UPI000374028C|nr:LPS export ABC transporter permease LptF [Gayadomonas joobiniege]
MKKLQQNTINTGIALIIFRYIFAETFKAQFAVFSVLLAIFSSQTLMRVLDDAMDGAVPTDLVLSMLSLSLPSLAGLILPLSLFIGIFLAHGEMYADSEMTVLKACGISEWYVTRVTLTLAVIIALITGFFALYWTPAAYQERENLREEIRANVGISSLIPGQFKESSNKKAVIFVHDNDPEKDLLDRVFVAQVSPSEANANRFDLVYANQGSVATMADGSEKLFLHNGTVYQGSTAAQNYQITDFEGYSMIIKERTLEEQRLRIMAVPTTELWGSQEIERIAELQWRISLPISVIIVAMIAVPLARVRPRQGKYAKLVPAFAIYLCYFLLLMAGKSAMEDGKIPPRIGVWWIHAGAFIYAAYLFTTERTMGRRLLNSLKRRPARA